MWQAVGEHNLVQVAPCLGGSGICGERRNDGKDWGDVLDDGSGAEDKVGEEVCLDGVVLLLGKVEVGNGIVR